MLVLTRKLNQEIQIGDNVKITVLKIKGNTVRLGIEAPRNVRVVRGELDRNSDDIHEPEMAEITVVLDRNNPPVSGDVPEIVPFPKSPASQSTVNYEAPVPSGLEHNRLKQIVEAIRHQRQDV